MKKLFSKLVLIYLLVFLTAGLNAQWKMAPLETKINFNSAVQLTDTKAFVVGDNGTLITTKNRGATWNRINIDVVGKINSIKFFNDLYTGFIVGDNGVILKTDSRWRSWDVLSVAANYFNNDVSFANELHGIVVGYKYLYNGDIPQSLATILVTHDGGLTWSEKTPIIPGRFNSVTFFDKDNAIAVGDAGLVAFTTDRGESWYMRNITAYNLNEVKVCPRGVKIIVGDNGTLFICKDEDRYRWLDISINSAYNLKSVCLNGSDTYVVTGEKKCILNGKVIYFSVILESKNLNGIWDLVFCNMAGTFNAVNFCNRNSAIAVGQKGTIALYRPALAQDTIVTFDSPTEIVAQNYPNPFNPSTVISFKLSEQCNVELKIYDVLGNEVATLVDEYKAAGSYEVEWNASNLPSGVYIYQLRSGTNTQMKKMLLLK
jgi:photosystem II stability/assembly factor-like uncharacterized protein